MSRESVAAESRKSAAAGSRESAAPDAFEKAQALTATTTAGEGDARSTRTLTVMDWQGTLRYTIKESTPMRRLMVAHWSRRTLHVAQLRLMVATVEDGGVPTTRRWSSGLRVEISLLSSKCRREACRRRELLPCVLEAVVSTVVVLFLVPP